MKQFALKQSALKGLDVKYFASRLSPEKPPRWASFPTVANRYLTSHSWMMLGEIIGEVVLTLRPGDYEVALSNAITDPVEMHVHGLGALLLDSVIGKAGSCIVVSLNWCRSLLEAEFLQSSTDGDSIFAVVEDACELVFGCAGHNLFQNVRRIENGAIVWRRLVVRRWCLCWILRSIAEVEMAGVAGLCVRFR